MKLILTLGITLFLLDNLKGQDTIRLERKPEVILKSWYPEFKEFPKLKKGESKILFILIPDFEKTTIRANTIELKTANGQADIKKTDKLNQYLVTANKAESNYIEFEVWLNLENVPILINQNAQWVEISRIYPLNNNKIMLQTIKLETN